MKFLLWTTTTGQGETPDTREFHSREEFDLWWRESPESEAYFGCAVVEE